MKNITLRVDGLANNYTRINKRKARNLYSEGMEILMYTIYANPHSAWIQPVFLNLYNNIDNTQNTNSFDSQVNSFEYYNCNNEMGYYSKFYVKEN